MTIPTTPADPGPIAISVLDIVHVVLRVLDAVRSPAYDTTFGARVAGFPRRFDSAIAVSPTILGPGGTGSPFWQQLDFPGASPPRVGSEQQAFCPPSGYAAQALRNWSVRRPASDLLRVFLRDFLYQNGYHNIDEAVDDTLQALDFDPDVAPVT